MPDDATRIDTAPQHGPRPLPLFLDMLRSETAQSPERRRRALAGLDAYQSFDRAAQREPLPIAARSGRATLRDYGGSGPPVVIVPSLINPPHVIDLAPGNSLAEALVRGGNRVLSVDWGEPQPVERAMDLAAHVTELLLPLLATLERPALVGYCLGGTLATAAAQLTEIDGLALVASPWRFTGYDTARPAIAELWHTAKPSCERLGLVPMEVLQSGFWRLDPARTIAKYEAFSEMPPDSAAAHSFVALEDWANAGAPLTLAAGADLFERFIAANDPGAGRWQVGGTVIDPARLTIPVLDVVSLSDRIVPASTAAHVGTRLETGAGHVGMVVGRRAPDVLWTPLTDWLAALR